MSTSAPKNASRRFVPWKMFVGAFVPNCILRFPGLSDSAKLLWGRLAQFAGKDGACHPSQSCLAEKLGKSTRQVRNLLLELVNKEFLEREAPNPKERGKFERTRYYFLWHPIFDGEHPLPPSTDGGEPEHKVEEIPATPDDPASEQAQPTETNFPTSTPTLGKFISPPSGNTLPYPRETDFPTLGKSISPPSGNTLPYPRETDFPTLGKYISSEEIKIRESRKEIHHHHTPDASPPDDPAQDNPDRGGGEKSFSSISEEQAEYIALKLSQQQAFGEISRPTCYRHKLENLARQGELDMSDLGDLKAWAGESGNLSS
ncbi:MAG: helix-turn-helix domain-containing protein [Desulfovibrionaceae bacterium]|nr:helix-turn-helix domain-containing protein [Desulfovibrionaceae bacterium]MBF0514842.1 helix-turn-helix domain-containing protein [Desulfovibrionaceae bacterium]